MGHARVLPLLAFALCACAPDGTLAIPLPWRSSVASNGLFVTAEGHVAPAVGEVMTVWALERSPQVAAVGARWEVDASDRGKVVLTPSREGTSCQLAIRFPGTIGLTATLGSATARLILVATAAPPSWRQVMGEPDGSYQGPYTFDNVPAVITSPGDWTRYWQGVAAYTAKIRHEPDNRPLPELPAVDLETASLVVIGTTLGNPRPGPVLARVDPSGTGLVEVGMPDERTNATSIAVEVRRLAVYQVAKLPATTRLVFDCRSNSGCPAGSPPPDPAPFAAVEAQTLVVGQPFDLPATINGVPLTWALAPRTAARASLAGNHLVPRAPGALVLMGTGGDETVTLVEAVAASADLERPLTGPLFGSLAGGSLLLRTPAEWLAFWTRHFYPGPGQPSTTAPLPRGVDPAPPGTSPPPPPVPPPVDLPKRNVLITPLDASTKPVVTSIEGGTVTLVQPGLVRAGSFHPAGAAGQGPLFYFDVPAIAGVPMVVVEAVPEVR
ncbi:MAG: hypothetical protein JWM80_6333 [Cyanobacteria bacterium RYN_339]|nr:hypothetical protein [Cyanobacteria bacterium RYN_339]